MFWILLLVAVCLLLYFLPTAIAVSRGYGYTGVIFAINLAAGWTALGWLVALVWSVWPTERALVEPFVGNFSGRGYRNAGDAFGAVAHGRERGRFDEASSDIEHGRFFPTEDVVNQLEKLARLRDAGVLSDQEFLVHKSRMMGSVSR